MLVQWQNGTNQIHINCIWYARWRSAFNCGNAAVAVYAPLRALGFIIYVVLYRKWLYTTIYIYIKLSSINIIATIGNAMRAINVRTRVNICRPKHTYLWILILIIVVVVIIIISMSQVGIIYTRSMPNVFSGNIVLDRRVAGRLLWPTERDAYYHSVFSIHS